MLQPVCQAVVEDSKLSVEGMGDFGDVLVFWAAHLAYHIMCDGLQGRFWGLSPKQTVALVKDHWSWIRSAYKASKQDGIHSAWRVSPQAYVVIAHLSLFWQREKMGVGAQPVQNDSKRAVVLAIDDLEVFLRTLLSSTLAGSEHEKLRNSLHHKLSRAKEAAAAVKMPVRAVDEKRKQAEFAILDMVEIQSEMESTLRSPKCCTLRAA